MRGQTQLPATLLRQARYQLVEGGRCPSNVVDERLARSWQRSLSAGLSPVGRAPCTDNLSGRALEQVRVQNHSLIRHAVPIMEYLFEQVRLSHSMVILADCHGVLVHTMGDLDFLGKAERVALACGASWHESQRGTNAIGTALAEAGDVEVHGAEHYLDRNGFLTCAAAPIVSATGELVGILDISGDHRSRHPHTLGLVSTAARMIENNLLLSACVQHTVLQLHTQAEGLGTIAQGVIAISDDGWLVGANRRALELLGLLPTDISRVRWAQCFDVPLSHVLGHCRQRAGLPLALHTARGQTLYAHVQSGAGVSVPVPRTLPEVGVADGDALGQLDTGDVRWRSAADKARRMGAKSIPLLVLGESGVGKELFAKAVHRASPRRTRPFVAINCAALPEHLIEAELFGYAPGAFTGARKQGSLGRLREAEGGTLFLDEIGDMPLSLQTRLLRVLQERQVTPLGSGESVAVDFWLICATHQRLREAVEQGRFRSDLYYRINGLTVQLPPLRERSDFAALTQRLLAEMGGPPGVQVAPTLMQALARYDWPGNLRQYSNVLRTAVALLEPQEVCISWAHMPEDVLDELERLDHFSAPTPSAALPAMPASLHQISQKAIEQALANHRGNVSAAARQLGISRQTFYRRLQQR
ncbi:MAG: sigma-54-dependent Fis family transcriptional regulator [Burkholderiaceae bacterium]|nr:sigma-54-dependent Fis family transcriptional regulator [Burkholderiaceae bacterium]